MPDTTVVSAFVTLSRAVWECLYLKPKTIVLSGMQTEQ
jgi:hypothetical protein